MCGVHNRHGIVFQLGLYRGLALEYDGMTESLSFAGIFPVFLIPSGFQNFPGISKYLQKTVRFLANLALPAEENLLFARKP